MFTPEKRMINKYTRNNIKIDEKFLKEVKHWLTNRDYKILYLLYRFPFLTVEQIEMIVFGNLSPASWQNKANERLRRLYHAHLIDRWFPPVSKGAGSSQQHVVLDKAGFIMLKGYLKEQLNANKIRKFRKRTYIPQTYQHTLKILDFYALLHVLNRQLGIIKDVNGKEEGTIGNVYGFKIEGDDDKDTVSENRLSMFYKDKQGERNMVRPDAFFVYSIRGKAKVFFLEIDNSTMDIEQLESKIKRYNKLFESGEWKKKRWAKTITNGKFPSVLLLMETEEAVNKVVKMIKKTNTNIRFYLTTYNKTITQEYKKYENSIGKKRMVVQNVKINLLEDIWVSNKEDGLCNIWKN